MLLTVRLYTFYSPIQQTFDQFKITYQMGSLECSTLCVILMLLHTKWINL